MAPIADRGNSRSVMRTKTRNSDEQKRSRGLAKGGGAHISPRASRARRAPTQSRARETVAVIVEAAGQLLVKHGREGVTTNQVADRAGVSIGSLYQYFSGKESIFGALQEQHRGEVTPLIEQTLASLADPKVDLVEAIVALMRAMAGVHQHAPARMRALADDLHEDASPAQLDMLVEAMVGILSARSGRPADSLRPTAWLACVALTQVGRTLVHHPPDVDLEELFASLARMLRGLLAGILPPAPLLDRRP
jgi:AcrR family transcriptional regulator